MGITTSALRFLKAEVDKIGYAKLELSEVNNHAMHHDGYRVARERGTRFIKNSKGYWLKRNLS